MNYLGYFIKEILRHAPPGVVSLTYLTYENTTLPKSGIKIPKDIQIRFNVYGSHWNPLQWREPESFIPERFDPESEWSKRPDNGKIHQHSFMPFSIGPRACPGRALGMMQLKVIVIFFVYHMDWLISQDQIEKDQIFTIQSHDQLQVSFKS